MLSRNVKRALLDTRWSLPPTFLLPWAAGFATVSHTTESTSGPPPTTNPSKQPASGRGSHLEAKNSAGTRPKAANSKGSNGAPPLPSPSSPSSSGTTPLQLSSTVRELLPLLRNQSPQYITIHIHGKPYLLTQGDTLKLPFLMHDVQPGDVLRLDRAVNIGSRDYTLKAAAAAPKLKSSTTDTTNVLDPTTSQRASYSRVMPDPSPDSAASGVAGNQQVVHAPHFIPHIAKGKHAYLDDRLFVCRAVVMGVESEPMRIKEKTKRRQRKVKKVKSKHKYTVLKVKELKVRGTEEIEGNLD